MRNWFGTIGMVGVLLACAFVGVADLDLEGPYEYEPRAPIYIFGNENFTAANGVSAGSGTESDPYVIEGWEIEAKKATGIAIRGTTAHFVIRNVHVHSSGLTHYGVFLDNVTTSRFEKCNITDNWMGVMIRKSSNISLVESIVTLNDEGAHVSDSSNVAVEGNTITENAPRNGIALVSSSNVTIRGNTISHNHRAGIYVASSTLVTISGNDISSNQLEGVRITTSSYIHISANTVTDNSNGLLLDSSFEIAISGSRFIANRMHGMHFDSSSQISADLIYASSNDRYGIHIWNSTEINLSHSTFKLNEFGVSMSNSENATVSECIAWNNPNGALVAGSSDVRFIGSDFFDNWVHGILVRGSDELTFERNRFHSNNVDGIRFVDATKASVRDNIFTENMRGVYLENSESIIVHHNKFADNTGHAHDNRGNENAWDDGYPSGGNYWSGYTGSDQFVGPGQNESGNDGIGDIPYVIDSNSQDNYPLMSPLGNVPSAPQSLQATWDDSYVNISWGPPSSDGGFPVTKYRIYRGTTSGGETYLADRPWLSHFNDTTVVNGVHYYYRVTAVNSVGEGPLSNEVASIPTAVPGSPRRLLAVLSGDDLKNLTVSWTLSSDDGTGQSSVVEYKVFRGQNYSHDGIGYELISALPNGTCEFHDGLAGEGDPNHYFYRVCAEDVNGKIKCSEDQVGKFTRPLSKGWNLVSVPLIPLDERSGAVLKTVDYSKVWLFDPARQEWTSFDESKPYSSNEFRLNHTMGFWVEVTGDSNLTVAGLVPLTGEIPLVPGWNLIGYSLLDKVLSVEEFKLLTGAESIEGFDVLSPPFFTRELHDSDFLMSGNGYWVWMPQYTS